MPDYSQAGRPLKVETALGTDALLLGAFTGVESLSEPYLFSLEMLSTKADLDATKILRTGAAVKWKLPDGSERVIHGLVRRFVQMGKRDELVAYRAEVVPWLWFLTLSRESRIHQQKSVPDIIELVFKDLGYNDFDIRCTRSYPTRDYCVQYRETHFNFVSRLMEEEGIFYFFEHSGSKHTLVLADGNSAAKSVPGSGTARVHSQPIHDEDVILTLEKDDSVFAGKVTLRSYDYLQPSLSLEASLSGDGKEEVYDYPGHYLSVDEGERYARIGLEAEEAMRKVLRGGGNCRNFGAGMTVEIKDTGGAKTKVLIREVRHSMGGNSVRAWDTSDEFEYHNSFTCIPESTPFRPRRRAPKSLVRGTQTALVVVAKGEEIWSDKHGRVKVQFHWDRKGEKNEKSSCWVRVATPWAGKGWGAVHLPRKGQEVIVDFLEGDPDRPIIIGSVYNAEVPPPYTLPANVTQSGIKSRSSKEGESDNFNEIRMEDKKGSELLYIHAQKDKNVVVENDRTEDVGHDESITIGNNRTESVSENESITIGGNRDETVSKNESVNVNKNRGHSIGGNDTLDVQGNRNVTVTKDSNTKVVKNASLTIDESWTVKVSKDHKEETTKNYSLKADKIFIEGKSEVEIKSGDASIILKSNGDVQIKGGKINVKGSGDVVIKGSKIGEN
jgi:type VI secretion system secreted protein VgrG